jgi:membrane fusion protein (multidrug efflux system)
VTLRGEFPNADGDLLPGMYVRVVVEQGMQANALTVPQQAIQRDGNGQAQLYILNSDGSLELRPVKAGRTVAHGLVINEGLKAGEQVVVEGFQKIRPGGRFTGKPWQHSASDPASASAEADKRG